MDPNGDETLDDLITGTSSVPTTQAVDSLHEHLSYPSLDTEDDSSRRESSSRSQSLPLFKDRIYVGNLHPSVDEYVSLLRLNQTTWLHSIRYTLVQVFSKFGKITSVDYLFHKSGPLKGKPRGYAFLKYADENVSPSFLFTLLPFVLSKELHLLIHWFAFPVSIAFMCANGSLSMDHRYRWTVLRSFEKTSVTLGRHAGLLWWSS